MKIDSKGDCDIFDFSHLTLDTKPYDPVLDGIMHERKIPWLIRLLTYMGHTNFDITQAYKSHDIKTTFKNKNILNELEVRCESDFESLIGKRFRDIHVPSRKDETQSDFYYIMGYGEENIPPYNVIIINDLKHKIRESGRKHEKVKNKRFPQGDNFTCFGYGEANMYALKWEDKEVKEMTLL